MSTSWSRSLDSARPEAAPGNEGDIACADSDSLIVINRKARGGRADLLPAIEALGLGGPPPRLLDVEDPADLAAQFELACTPDIKRVVIAGGDGTINSALPVLMKHRRPVGIIPLGTANDLARTLKIPADPMAAAAIIAAGHTHRIDVASVNARYFLNAAGIGFSAELQRELAPGIKGLFGPLAYPIGVLKRWRRRRPFTAVVRGDGIAARHRVIQVTVANGRFYGGGMTAHEGARIDDAALDILLIRVGPLWRYVFSAASLKSGVYAENAPVVALRAKQFELWTRRPRAVATDGEISTSTPASFSVSAQALEVYVPHGAA